MAGGKGCVVENVKEAGRGRRTTAVKRYGKVEKGDSGVVREMRIFQRLKL